MAVGWAVVLMSMMSMNALADEDINADNKPVVKVWPGKAPGETGEIGPEQVRNRDPKLGAPVIRLTDVTEPSMTLYRVQSDTPATTVLVCPGGGYSILAWNLEGTEIARWLNSLGVNAAVLKYRVPARKGRPRHEAPLQDAQRAIRLLRANAKDWGIAADRIGMLGFSAGGHLSAAASTSFDAPAYEPADETDKLSCRPDFTVLIYPAFISDQDPQKLSPEIAVTDKTPPAFIAQTQDDGYANSAVGYFLALKKAKVPAELHMYPTGGHGYGMRRTGTQVMTWPDRCAEWMRARELIK